MRIVLWSEQFPPYLGGVERTATLLLAEMCKRGYEFIIVTAHQYLSLPDEDLWHGIPLHRFSVTNALAKGDLATWAQELKRMERLIAAFDPALHHIFGIGPLMVGCLQILKKRPAPLIVALANLELRPQEVYAPNGTIGKTLLAANWITTVSQALLEQTVEYLPTTRSHISVLYSGYPAPTIEIAPLATPPCLLLLGRLVPQKGGEMAIAAFRKLYHRYPDARLIIAGDGPLRESWQQLAGGMEDRVEFTGWISPGDVYALMNRVTIVLMPSNWEGLPIVAIEAAFMKRPMVATRIPGMSEIVMDGESGLLVERGDVEGLAEAIAYLIDNPEQVAAMGRAAAAFVEKNFTLERFGREHDELYQRVAEMV